MINTSHSARSRLLSGGTTQFVEIVAEVFGSGRSMHRCENLIRILHSCLQKNYYENDSFLSTIITLAKQFMINDYQDISHKTNHSEHQAPLAVIYPKVTAELLGISEVIVVLESFFCGVFPCRIYGRN